MKYQKTWLTKLGLLTGFLFFSITVSKAIDFSKNDLIVLDTTEIDTLIYLCGDSIALFGQTFTESGIYEIFQEGPADMDTLIFLELVESNLGGFSVSPSDTTICFGESLNCTLVDENGDLLTSASSILWSESAWFECDTCAATIFQGLDTMVYRVDFLDENGCPQGFSGTYISERDADCFLDRVVIPNAFRPNSQVDDVNKTFGPIYYKSAQKLDFMRIYNRWGEVVFETNFELEERGTWDGNLKSDLGGHTSPAPMDVYYYDLVVFCPSVNKYRSFKGEVTLIR
jgi:hypothetical protein